MLLMLILLNLPIETLGTEFLTNSSLMLCTLYFKEADVWLVFQHTGYQALYDRDL